LNQDFDFGGYFVQDLVPEKLSVINLNSMYFYKNDLEVKDCDDPASPGAIEMKWFEKALKHYYNKKGHQVYVVGHVPPIADDGTSLYKDACYSQYLYLLGKYGSIISGHFTGHTNGRYPKLLLG
jgi:histone deacetylase complex regulatory component SIN3